MPRYSRSTVGDLIRNGRTLRWECDLHQPGHDGEVDLQRILDERGADFMLSNRRPPCRIAGCLGRVQFKDCTSFWPFPIDTIDDPRATWAFDDERRITLKARGWRIEMGKWIPPKGE